MVQIVCVRMRTTNIKYERQVNLIKCSDFMCLIKDFDEIMLMSKRKAESNTIKETATTTATEKYKTSQRKIARDRNGGRGRDGMNENQITSPIMRNTNDFNEKLGKQRNYIRHRNEIAFRNAIQCSGFCVCVQFEVAKWCGVRMMWRSM